MSALGRVTRHAQNLLEVARYGGLQTGEAPAEYEVVDRGPHHRLRHYSLGLPEDAPSDPARATADGQHRGLRRLAAGQRGPHPRRARHPVVGGRLRRSRARTRRPRADLRGPHPRGRPGSDARARGDRCRGAHRRLLAGRHVLLPDRCLSTEQGRREHHRLRLPRGPARQRTVASARAGHCGGRPGRRKRTRRPFDPGVDDAHRLPRPRPRRRRHRTGRVPLGTPRPRRAAPPRRTAPVPDEGGLGRLPGPLARVRPRPVRRSRTG